MWRVKPLVIAPPLRRASRAILLEQVGSCPRSAPLSWKAFSSFSLAPSLGNDFSVSAPGAARHGAGSMAS